MDDTQDDTHIIYTQEKTQKMLRLNKKIFEDINDNLISEE